MIYLISVEEYSMCKIGFSKAVHRRIPHLRTGVPFDLKVAAQRDGGRKLEKEMHRQLAHLRIRGEWFKMTDEVLDVFNNATALEIEAKDRPVMGAYMNTFAQSLAAWLADIRNTQAALGEAIGKSQPTVQRYAKGERFPDADTARLIDAYTEGQVPFSAWKCDYLAQAGLLDEDVA